MSADGQSWADVGRRDRLHEQDLADHLLALAAQGAARARLREPLVRRAAPDRAARARRLASSAPRRRRRAATSGTTRTSNGVSFRDYGMYTTIPGDCKGAGNTSTTTRLDDSRFGDHVERVLRRLQPELLRPCATGCRSGSASSAPTSSSTRRTPSATRCRSSRSCGCPTTTRTARRPGARSRRPTWPTTTSRSAGWSTSSRTAAFWKNTAIFVTEDDAQNGPDHIDAHRTLSYVISPYTQTRPRSTRRTTTRPRMVATIEDLLGLPPMSIADQRADPDVEGLQPQARPARLRRADAERAPFGAPGAQLNPPTAPMARRVGAAGTSRSRTRRPRSGSTRRSGSRSTDATPRCRTRATTTSSARCPPTRGG